MGREQTELPCVCLWSPGARLFVQGLWGCLYVGAPGAMKAAARPWGAGGEVR